MLPALVLPFYDPDGRFFDHLQAILPDLKINFSRAYISLPATSARLWPENTQRLLADDFFKCYPLDSESPMGEHFGFLYRQTALDAPAGQILHLCFPDRLTFALRTDYRDSFLADVASLRPEHLPLIFHRSTLAWSTHPKNYLEIEGFVTRIGETLFGKSLDYGWCHLVVQAGELGEVMNKINRPDLPLIAEMVLHMQHHAQTREVDWLAWEDPFILGRDPAELKAERENSLAETQKRLSYCLPMVEILAQFTMNGKK
jgi:hypothetical protein